MLDVDLFDYGALPPYVTSSRDQELLQITRRQRKKFCGSTSSLTGLLSHCYYALSRWREPRLTGFSPSFTDMPSGFSEGTKVPVSVKLQRQPEGFYAVDADKGADGDLENSNYVLTSLGKSLEKMLTTTPEDYAMYERVNSWQLSEDVRRQPEAYHYAQTKHMLMRSQLDCHDPRLPNKTFDLKTRAVVSVRNDRANYVEASGYQILRGTGLFESFEREYWDMVRSAFLKYNFQARIGHMDGIFVAYHNTAKMFGFQYISLEEMNLRLFGSNEMGDKAYHLSLGMLEQIFHAATTYIENESVALTVETRPGAGSMTVFVEPVESGGDKVQFDVTMDRYLDGALVRGPVDISALQGSMSDAQWEEMLQRRSGKSIEAVDWHVDYCITPRYDLSQGVIRENLKEVRQRQQMLQVMSMPNVKLLNEREQQRINVLARRPEALQRFLTEREDGTAMGMPLAPGQLTTRQLIEKKGVKLSETEDKKEDATATRWQRLPDPMTRRLRELSQHGAALAKEEEAKDPHKLYERMS